MRFLAGIPEGAQVFILPRLSNRNIFTNEEVDPIGKKRKRDTLIQVWVSEAEYDMIQARMKELGTENLSAYIRKMALNGYALNVDLSPVRELVSLQRRCANNLNQVAIHANTQGVYPDETAALQRDYAALWGPLSELLKQLAAIVKL